MHILFLTRKYPPAVGGMETFSYELNQHYPGPHTLVARGKRQRDIWWAAPVLLLHAFRLRKTVQVIHLGDLVLAPLAPLIRLFFRGLIVATAHGLELTHRNPLLRALLRRSLPTLTHVVAVSAHTQSLARAAGIDAARLTIIPHGCTAPITRINHDEARAAIINHFGLAVEPNQPILLTVGRLEQRKGVEWYIREVLPQLTDMNPLYVVTSRGPEQRNIERAIEETGQEARVLLTGVVEQEMLEQLYAGADAFIMPNRHVEGDVEGFGFVAIEAAVRGLPVFAANLEGIPTAIHDGHNGTLLPPEHADAWAQTLRTALQDTVTLRDRGVYGAEYTRQHFQWQTVAETYQSLFTSLTTTQ